MRDSKRSAVRRDTMGRGWENGAGGRGQSEKDHCREGRSGGPPGRDGREDLLVLTLLFGLDPTAAPANPTPPLQELFLWSDVDVDPPGLS